MARVAGKFAVRAFTVGGIMLTEIGSYNCLANAASMLARRAFRRGQPREAAVFRDTRASRSVCNTAGRVLTVSEQIESVRARFRVPAGRFGMTATSRDQSPT